MAAPMSEPHKDTSGDYEQALAGLVSGSNGLTADHPAPAAGALPVRHARSDER